jgi:hypothetical protein
MGRALTANRVRGGVAQLVRASACHAEGRGFEPRRSRQYREFSCRFNSLAHHRTATLTVQATLDAAAVTSSCEHKSRGSFRAGTALSSDLAAAVQSRAAARVIVPECGSGTGEGRHGGADRAGHNALSQASGLRDFVHCAKPPIVSVFRHESAQVWGEAARRDAGSRAVFCRGKALPHIANKRQPWARRSTNSCSAICRS